MAAERAASLRKFGSRFPRPSGCLLWEDEEAAARQNGSGCDTRYSFVIAAMCRKARRQSGMTGQGGRLSLRPAGSVLSEDNCSRVKPATLVMLCLLYIHTYTTVQP